MEETACDGETPLQAAAACGNLSQLSVCLSRLTEANRRNALEARNALGLTPLHITLRSATWLGDAQVLPLVRLLLSAGANPNVQSFSRFAVQEAIECGLIHITAALTETATFILDKRIVRQWSEASVIDSRAWPRDLTIQRATSKLLWAAQ